MKSWGIRLHATKRFLAKYRTRPKPHISLPTSAESSHVEQYSFSWDYDRRHAIFIDLRKVVGPAPTLFSELDKDPFARRKGYGGTKGHLRYKVGYKKIRGPGHCSRGRCMHMLIDELNGIAVLPLTPKSYIMCHVSVPREGDPKAKTFTDLFNICLSIQKIP